MTIIALRPYVSDKSSLTNPAKAALTFPQTKPSQAELEAQARKEWEKSLET